MHTKESWVLEEAAERKMEERLRNGSERGVLCKSERKREVEKGFVGMGDCDGGTTNLLIIGRQMAALGRG